MTLVLSNKRKSKVLFVFTAMLLGNDHLLASFDKQACLPGPQPGRIAPFSTAQIRSLAANRSCAGSVGVKSFLA